MNWYDFFAKAGGWKGPEESTLSTPIASSKPTVPKKQVSDLAIGTAFSVLFFFIGLMLTFAMTKSNLGTLLGFGGSIAVGVGTWFSLAYLRKRKNYSWISIYSAPLCVLASFFCGMRTYDSLTANADNNTAKIIIGTLVVAVSILVVGFGALYKLEKKRKQKQEGVEIKEEA